MGQEAISVDEMLVITRVLGCVGRMGKLVVSDCTYQMILPTSSLGLI
jgi:hypothetical protein